MKILITGCAGFVGFHLTQYLLNQDHIITGVDNLNDYYDVNLKYSRLAELGIYKENIINNVCLLNPKHNNLHFFKADLNDHKYLNDIFYNGRFDMVCNLAAQAGVRYSLTNPQIYIDSNIQGFFNVLECCRVHNVKKVVYASSSSVYGLNKEKPFSTTHKADNPASLYAATKRCNELMAHTYSHLFKIETIGLRFFTVYGPWGRPDMALYSFTKNILANKPIQVYNNGKMKRDFTYVDDIVEGMVRVINKANQNETHFCDAENPCKVINIGHGNPVPLIDFITEIEKNVGIKAKKEYLPMQDGDVEETWADVNELKNEYQYQPVIGIAEGVRRFVKWYRYYNHQELISVIKKSI
jgi:UDP-glucuronate 4-epimerase